MIAQRRYHVLFCHLVATIVVAFLPSKGVHGTSLARVRGGASYYEANPNYSAPPTLGDLDEQGAYRAAYPSSTLHYSYHQRPRPFTQVLRNYFDSLHQFSPTLFYGTSTSLFFFILWQFQSTSHSVAKILHNHFVCSQYNVVEKKRLHAALFSAFSHASLQHLAVNLYAYSTFGRSVKQTLAIQGVDDLWPFVVSAALFASLTFLLIDSGRGGSCMGLSGVTLALLAFDSLVYPSKELRMIVSFIPIQLPAYYLFLGLVGVSVAGSMGLIGGNVAHSTHLGGLVYGKLYYEALKRGWVRRAHLKCRKVYYAIRN